MKRTKVLIYRGVLSDKIFLKWNAMHLLKRKKPDAVL